MVQVGPTRSVLSSFTGELARPGSWACVGVELHQKWGYAIRESDGGIENRAVYLKIGLNIFWRLKSGPFGLGGNRGSSYLDVVGGC